MTGLIENIVYGKGRTKSTKPPSALTLARNANKLTGRFSDDVIYTESRLSDDKGSILDKKGEKSAFHLLRKYDVDNSPIVRNGVPCIEERHTFVFATDKLVQRKTADAQKKRWTNLQQALKKSLADDSAASLSRADLRAWIQGDTEDALYLRRTLSGAIMFCGKGDKDAVRFADVPRDDDAKKCWQTKLAALASEPKPKVDLTAEIEKTKRVLANMRQKIALKMVPEGFADTTEHEMAAEAVAERLRKLESQAKRAAGGKATQAGVS